MRSWPLVGAVLAAGCSPAVDSPHDPVVDYRLVMPAEFVRDLSAVPIDSKVEVWTAPGVEVGTDFGQHGAIPDCGTVREPWNFADAEVDGRAARVVRLGPDRSGQHELHVFVPLDRVDGPVIHPLSLAIHARCSTRERCEALLPVLLRADLIEGVPASEVAPPVPPVPRPKQT